VRAQGVYPDKQIRMVIPFAPGGTTDLLARAVGQHFSQAWGQLQSQFVDNPTGVVIEADRLVRDLMVKRGYPMADFERRAADISVHHPTVVDTYRSARDIAARSQQGTASTEDLRKAVVYYRSLFDELLEVRRDPAAASADAAARKDEEVHS